MNTRDCWNCMGMGKQKVDGLTIICDVCNGTGVIYQPPRTIDERQMEAEYEYLKQLQANCRHPDGIDLEDGCLHCGYYAK